MTITTDYKGAWDELERTYRTLASDMQYLVALEEHGPERARLAELGHQYDAVVRTMHKIVEVYTRKDVAS